MTDLEVIDLCAKAVGIEYCLGNIFGEYDPLHDDSQAMALEDWLISNVRTLSFGANTMIVTHMGGTTEQYPAMNKAMRQRALCECVAKMQLEKAKV